MHSGFFSIGFGICTPDLPQGIYNRDILCLESESIKIGPISGVFEQLVYLGILNACGSKTPFRTGFPSSLTTCETGSWGGGRLCLMQLWASWPTTVSVIGLGGEGDGWMDGWMGECAAHFSSRKL